MYKTKGEIKSYVFGSGEKIEISSKRVIPWNEKTDERYDLNDEILQESYDYICARITLNTHYNKLVKELSNDEMASILMNYVLVFNYKNKIEIPNAELVMIYHDDGDDDRFIPAWVSLDDLEIEKML